MSPIADQFQVNVRWLDSRPLVSGRRYVLKLNDQQVVVMITALKYRLDEATHEQLYAKKLNAGETGIININAENKLDVKNATAIQFLDPDTQELVATGNIEFALHRATNIRWQQLSIDKAARAQQKQQQPLCVWFTGLSGSGKSTIANLLEKKLFDNGNHTYLLDGDNVRHGLNRDLGFTEADRVENIRRVAEVAKLMVDAGLIVIASFISPFHAERQMARQLFAANEFIEVFVDTPLAECEKRDVKGLYAKARRGELKNFTGIDSAYERPEHPELSLDTCNLSAEECVEQVIHYLLNRHSAASLHSEFL